MRIIRSPWFVLGFIVAFLFAVIRGCSSEAQEPRTYVVQFRRPADRNDLMRAERVLWLANARMMKARERAEKLRHRWLEDHQGEFCANCYCYTAELSMDATTAHATCVPAQPPIGAPDYRVNLY